MKKAKNVKKRKKKKAEKAGQKFNNNKTLGASHYQTLYKN